MNSAPPPIPDSETAEAKAPRQPSLVLKIATGLVTALSLIILISSARTIHGPGEESRMIGYVIGGIVFWPGVVTIIFSLSKKYRSPHRSCSAWLVATSLIACLNFVTVYNSAGVAERSQNRDILESMREGSLEARQELLETDDMNRVVELQRQSINQLEDNVANLTGESQLFAEAAMKVMRPLMQASENYSAASAQLFEQLEDVLQHAQSGEDFSLTAQTLEQLIQQHDELITLIEDFTPGARRTLAQTEFTPRIQQDVLDAVKSGFDPQVPYLKVVRRTEAEMLLLYREWITLLSDRWVEWERDEEFAFTWSTDEGLAAHNEIFENLGELGEEQNAAQQGLLEVAQRMK